MSWMRTYTGKRFDPYDLEEAVFDIEDIAHALSNICRFVGHSKSFYSVAQHSAYVAEIVKNLGASQDVQLAALMHDASEAYLADIPAPMKRHKSFKFYRDLEEEVQGAIHAKFGLILAADVGVDVIGLADRICLSAEARDLMGNPQDWENMPMPWQKTIVPIGPSEAEALFLQTFKELSGAEYALHCESDSVP